ncbi:MAG: SDR family oxidoreductase [Pyrinomonadaceae bacterium]|nr:SDR family oxidoreductase [Pyrinomonadaceae bacterium]
MENKVAIVTGSTAGIGFAIAKNLALKGAKVVINGRTLEKLKQAETEIESVGGRILAIQADATDESEIKRIVNETVQYFGGIDILVNNAATTGVGKSVAEMPVETWDTVMNVNLRGVFLFCQSVIPHLTKKKWGRIISIGGLSSKNPLAFGAADAASKAGLLALMRCLAAELGEFNVTVNAILPGIQPNTETGQEFIEKIAQAFKTNKEVVLNATIQRTLLKRHESMDEVAETVAFLCTDGAGAITGQNLNVNCGLATY